MMRKFVSTALLAGAAAFSLSACFQGYEGVYLEAEDVSLDMPADEFRAGAIDGPYFWSEHTAREVNGWVKDVVETSATIVAVLNRYPATSQEGEWRVYGPFEDEANRDLSWSVRINGDASETGYEILVGNRADAETGELDVLVAGTLSVADDERAGEVTVDFDTYNKYDDLRRADELTTEVGGDILITFSRNTTTDAKTIDLDFDGFYVQRESFLDDDNFASDEAYHYERAEDGSGNFSLAIFGEFDDHNFSGSELERMQLDSAWTAEGAGRASGQIEESDGSGDLQHGDLHVIECFDANQDLTWRWVNEPYSELAPDYGFGSEDTCVL